MRSKSFKIVYQALNGERPTTSRPPACSWIEPMNQGKVIDHLSDRLEVVAVSRPTRTKHDRQTSSLSRCPQRGPIYVNCLHTTRCSSIPRSSVLQR